LISKTATKKMFDPFCSTYACGWDIGLINREVCHQHFGDINGFVSSIKQLPEKGYTIIFLSNQEVIPATSITEQIAKICLGESWLTPCENELSLPDKLSSAIASIYQIENTDMKFELSEENDFLYLTIPKRYGIRYSFKVSLQKDEKNKIFLRTEKIDEVLWFAEDEQSLSIYQDSSSKEFRLKKLN